MKKLLCVKWETILVLASLVATIRAWQLYVITSCDSRTLIISIFCSLFSLVLIIGSKTIKNIRHELLK